MEDFKKIWKIEVNLKINILCLNLVKKYSLLDLS